MQNLILHLAENAKRSKSKVKLNDSDSEPTPA